MPRYLSHRGEPHVWLMKTSTWLTGSVPAKAASPAEETSSGRNVDTSAAPMTPVRPEAKTLPMPERICRAELARKSPWSQSACAEVGWRSRTISEWSSGGRLRPPRL